MLGVVGLASALLGLFHFLYFLVHLLLAAAYLEHVLFLRDRVILFLRTFDVFCSCSVFLQEQLK